MHQISVRCPSTNKENRQVQNRGNKSIWDLLLDKPVVVVQNLKGLEKSHQKYLRESCFTCQKMYLVKDGSTIEVSVFCHETNFFHYRVTSFLSEDLFSYFCRTVSGVSRWWVFWSFVTFVKEF